MGVLKQGILGGFANKVGNVVGTSWKGIPVIKARPLSVANPNTAGQITNRTAFALASKIGSQILGDWIKPYWDRFSAKMSGYNSWVKANVQYMADGVIDDYSLLIMSNGKLSPATTFGLSADASDNSITISQSSTNINQFSATSDVMSLLIYNETQDYWRSYLTAGYRSDTSIPVGDSRMVAGDLLHGWVSFRRADGTYVSPSTYANVTVVA